jgi:hypothetical protein
VTIPSPSDDQQGAARKEEEIPLITKSSSADQGTPLIETDSLPNDKKKKKKTAHTHKIKFLQINLHHSKAAMAALCQQLAQGKADVALIKEPWLYKGRIRGLTNTGGRVYSVVPENNARSCIYVRSHINALPLLEFCSRDATTVRITYTYGRVCEELIVASAYFPYDADEPPPTKEMRDITDHCQSKKKATCQV